jgi:iron(III) transport system permease protein
VFSEEKRRWLAKIQTLAIALFLIPSCIHVQGWLSFFALLHLPIQGFIPALWVSSIYYMPLSLVLISIATSNLSTKQVEAAKVYLPNKKVMTHILLPSLKPVMMVCLILTTLLSLADYAIPSLFNVNVIALDIVSEYSFSGYTRIVIIEALPTILLGLGLVIIGGKAIKKSVINANAYQKKVNITFNFAVQCLYYTTLGIIGITVILLLINVFSFITDFQNAMREVVASGEQFVNTVVLSLGASCLAQFIAYGYAKHLMSKKQFNLSIILLLIPLSIPSSLMGVSMLYFFKNTFLYSSIALPIIVLAIRFLPVAVLIYYATLKAMDRSMVEAAIIYRQHRLKHLVDMMIPMLLPVIIANSGILFVLSMGEVGLTLMTVPPGFNTVTIKLYNYLHYGASETVAALSACMMLLTVIPTLVSIKWLKRKLKIT